MSIIIVIDTVFVIVWPWSSDRWLLHSQAILAQACFHLSRRPPVTHSSATANIMKSLTFVMLMTSLLTCCVHVQAMISSSIVPMAASSSLEVPPVPEPSDLSQIIAIEDELPA